MVESTGELRVIRTPEQQEQERRDRAAFLGGIFATGGRISFTIENQTKTVGGVERTYKYAYPFISFGDENLIKIAKLKEIFGGRTKPNGKNPVTWYLKSEDAVDLAMVIRDFCPNRGEIITAFENWENADTEEKLRLARDFREKEEANFESYRELVRNPQFLAGVLTARGGLSNALRRGAPRGTVLFFSSTNEQLVKALKKEYGAGIMQVGKKSNQTTFGETATARILELTRDHLLVPLKVLQEDE